MADVKKINGYNVKDETARNGLLAKQDIMQFSTLPADANWGKIVQYIGATDANYTNGYFYKAYADLDNVVTPSGVALSIADKDDFLAYIMRIESLMSYFGRIDHIKITIQLSQSDNLLYGYTEFYNVNNVRGSIVSNYKLSEYTQNTGLSITGASENDVLTANVIVSWERIDVQPGGGSSSGYHPDLFDCKWADHILNDAQWLRADTFSWQYGSMYQVAYANLSTAIAGKTLQSETVAGITVQFYLADDGHKICPASEETNVTAIYNATGVAWYYIIDTVNQRFKLPRTKFGVVGLRDNVGDYVEPGLPNITGGVDCTAWASGFGVNGTGTGALYAKSSWGNNAVGDAGTGNRGVGLDASLSNSIYGNSDTVEAPATQMYLYFYVGNFTQTALENTVGLNAELFNGKADLNLANVLANIDFVVERQEPTAANNYTWYRKYRSGWVEQGGYFIPTVASGDINSVINLPIMMSDLYYTVEITAQANTDLAWHSEEYGKRTQTSFGIQGNAYNNAGIFTAFSWKVSGMAA